LIIQPVFDSLDHHRLHSFGSSDYAKEILHSLWGSVPVLNLGDEYWLQKALIKLANKGLMRTARDVSEGGLAVALAESSFAGNIGIVANREGKHFPYKFWAYFEEPASVVLVTCARENRAAVEAMVEEEGELYCEYIGETAPGKLDLRIDDEPFLVTEIGELKGSWTDSLESHLSAEVEA
jgi:phosphoribosylformylglycinamidine (FGAM) synthase-like enzyme